MTTVAIAGGTGNIGRTLVEVLSENPKNTGSTATTDAKATIVHIDYGDVESISQALEKHQIDTVISCLSMIDESSGESELNLIRAADTSSATRRFIPNDWGVPLPESQISAFPIFKYQKAAIELLQKSKLQWTVFYIGYIMDYFGAPNIHTRMVGPPVFVDVANNVAALPGTGNEPIVLTYSFDLARFVDGLLATPDWPQRSIVIGDKLTWNKFVKLAESARGTKFDVSYDSFETLEAGSVTELPCYKAVYSFYPKEQLEYFLAMVGRGMVSGAKEMLEKAWKRE
ncbi:NmrA-like family protein [Neofusicoccum parvum]|nr:NmrA-like family protein [Neofusicoccum parvum]